MELFLYHLCVVCVEVQIVIVFLLFLPFTEHGLRTSFYFYFYWNVCYRFLSSVSVSACRIECGGLGSVRIF